MKVRSRREAGISAAHPFRAPRPFTRDFFLCSLRGQRELARGREDVECGAQEKNIT